MGGGGLMPNRYYAVKRKDGTVRKYRVHDSVTGRITGYVDADDLEEPEGEFRIVEWVLHWEYTDGTPSGLRHWEIRLQLPDSYDEDDVKEIASSIMWSYVSEELITSSNFGFDKRGIDFIGYERSELINYKVIDTARPQYSYPKRRRWGTWAL